MRHIRLYENFNSPLQVYHRTSPDGAADIMKHGFRPGMGANYGKGIYFYAEPPQEGDMSGRGNVVVQGEISDFSGFLITDPQWAANLLGDEADLVSQLQNIMGQEWISTHDIQPILDRPNFMGTLTELNRGRFKREDTLEKKEKASVIGKELKGWIRRNEDPKDKSTWVICYDPTRIKPVKILE